MSPVKRPGFAPHRSRTGIPGVCLCIIHGRRYFVAKCGKRQRQFSLARLGQDAALRGAVAARAAYEIARADLPVISAETRARLAAMTKRSWADPAARARREAAIRVAMVRRTWKEAAC